MAYYHVFRIIKKLLMESASAVSEDLVKLIVLSSFNRTLFLELMNKLTVHFLLKASLRPCSI